MLVSEVIASVYLLLNDCSEEELSYPIVIEQFASVLAMMNYERILGNVSDVIVKEEVSFTDTTGLLANDLEDFGDVVYLEFNGQPIDECPASMLDIYKDSGIQRAAFWTDGTVTGDKFIQISIPQTGTLKVWYEPDISPLNDLMKADTVDLQESLRWCLATRLAANCIIYVNYKKPEKAEKIVMLQRKLEDQAENWKNIYLEKINKIGLDRPFQRLPFMAANPTG